MHPFHFSGYSQPTFSRRALGGLAILFAAASVITAAPPAEAQQPTYSDSFYQGWFRSPYQAYRPRHHERVPARRPVERRPVERRQVGRRPAEPKAVEGNKAVGPLYAVVSLADQHVSFYDANGLWERSVISTGVAGHPTPPGIFTILEKERWHRSNIYSGAPMPYMQRLAWTGVAMHEGVVTGRPASHGCIRLPGAFAKRLFGLTNVGQRVVVSPEDITPLDIVNAHLPVPQLQTPPPGAVDKIAATKGGKAVETVALDKPAAGADTKLLNPAQFAHALKGASEANAIKAAQAKKAALAVVATKSEEARQAARELSIAEESVRRIKAEIEDANRSIERAQGDEAIKKATDRKSAAEAKLAETEGKVREASEAKAAKDQDLVFRSDRGS